MNAPLTVTDLARALKDLVNDELGDVSVVGEISQFTAHRSGHWYFSIKDAGAVLSCVMFRGDNSRVRFTPRIGEQVVLSGGLDVYVPQGRLSLIVRSIARAGAGDLQAQLEALKARLAEEGLFDPERKQPLPPLPRAIGVATSPTGAAFQDILKVLDRRFPGLTVYLAPCRVQGDGAAAEVAAALALLDAHGKSDVIIVGRGGGSIEDLWAFNEEPVVRAIAACHTPVVSAVGHEVDVTLADLVADVRAATPSHAAELVVPERDGLLDLVAELQARLVRTVERDVARRREQVARLRLRDPRSRVVEARLRCDELSDRLFAAARRDGERRRHRLALSAGRLDALSPLSVLDRGYAVALRDGRAVKDAAALSVGDALELRLLRGGAEVRVEKITTG